MRLNRIYILALALLLAPLARASEASPASLPGKEAAQVCAHINQTGALDVNLRISCNLMARR